MTASFNSTVVGTHTSNVGGGGKNHTTNYSDGASRDVTVNQHGSMTAVTDHGADGSSHSHQVNQGIFGSSIGAQVPNKK